VTARLIARPTPREPAVPTFRKSPPELIARFDELAPLAGDADRKLMFCRAVQNGQASCRVTASSVRR
jgi:hypothetical protein